MPIRHTGAGWWWGSQGPFDTKAKALAVAQAAYANGYKEDAMQDTTCAEFVLTLFHAVTNTHLLHLQTRSYSIHKALGKFYPELEDLIDTFAEAYQGKYGIITGYKNDYSVPSEPLPYLIQISDYIKATRANLPQDSELQNTIDDIAILTDGTIYKLRFLS